MPHATGLWYEWHGPENGEIVVLSPGLGGSGGYWAPNLAALSECYRILLYDHRGTGRSERQMPMADLSGDILGLMDALDIDRAHLIGHAAGGIAGLQLALDRPDRLGKLVVVNGWARLDPHFARCFEARLALLHGSGVRAYVRAQPIFLYPAEWISTQSDAIDAEAEGVLAHFPEVEVLERRIAALKGFDIDERLGEIRTPTLLVAAADDMLVPAHCSKRLADGIAGAQLATMIWGGHGCNVTDPAGFNRFVLDFLGS